jgi:hypothetical protein
MQLRLIESLTFITLCSLALVAQTSAPKAQKSPETQKTVHQLFLEDQEDLQAGADGMARFTEEEYQQRVAARQAMLAAGEVKAGGDFRDAAVIFQHGKTADDFLFAHILAMEAMARGTANARWIVAATLDRYLQFIKEPQVFGTQYLADPNVPLPLHAGGTFVPFGRTLGPYNESFLSDKIRTDFCVPTLAQQKQNVAMFNAGKWPRETMHPPCH